MICGFLELFSKDSLGSPAMLGVHHEQSGFDGGGDREPIQVGILIIPPHLPIDMSGWRQDWTVRRFLALCKKKGSIPNAPPLLPVAPLL